MPPDQLGSWPLGKHAPHKLTGEPEPISAALSLVVLRLLEHILKLALRLQAEKAAEPGEEDDD